MAERMGRLREKERDMRDAFLEQLQALVPPGLLAGLGLTQQPPHCQISLPPQPQLPRITPADLRAAAPSSDALVRNGCLLEMLPSKLPPCKQGTAH